MQNNQNNKKTTLDDKVNPLAELYNKANKAFASTWYVSLGVGITCADIFSLKYGFSPPIYNALSHAFFKFVASADDVMRDFKPNKKLAIGNLIAIGAYTYLNYGEPIRKFLDSVMVY